MLFSPGGRRLGKPLATACPLPNISESADPAVSVLQRPVQLVPSEVDSMFCCFADIQGTARCQDVKLFCEMTHLCRRSPRSLTVELHAGWWWRAADWGESSVLEGVPRRPSECSLCFLNLQESWEVLSTIVKAIDWKRSRRRLLKDLDSNLISCVSS